jgi:hypothetical protein
MSALSKRRHVAALQKTPRVCPAESASLRLDYIQWNSAFGVAVNLQFEVVISGALKMKTEMLPDVNMCLRLLTRNANLKILPDRFEDWPHVWIAEVHLEPVTAFLADIKPQLTSERTQRMITGEGMSSDRVKRSQNVQFTASHRCRIAKGEYLSLHGKNTSILKRPR